MKVIVKTFSTKKFDANISSWSNQEVASFLNEVIHPKNADEVIKKLTQEQIYRISDKLGSEPKLPAKFKDIYQQFKSVKPKKDITLDEIPKSGPKKLIKVSKPKEMWDYFTYVDVYNKGYKYMTYVEKDGLIYSPRHFGESKLGKSLSVFNKLISDELLTLIANVCIKFNTRASIEVAHYNSDGENSLKIGFQDKNNKLPKLEVGYMIDGGTLVITPSGESYDKRADKADLMNRRIKSYIIELKKLV